MKRIFSVVVFFGKEEKKLAKSNINLFDETCCRRGIQTTWTKNDRIKKIQTLLIFPSLKSDNGWFFIMRIQQREHLLHTFCYRQFWDWKFSSILLLLLLLLLSFYFVFTFMFRPILNRKHIKKKKILRTNSTTPIIYFVVYVCEPTTTNTK